MYISGINIDSEGFRMFHGTVGLIKNQHLESEKSHFHSGVQQIYMLQNSHIP